MLREHQHASKKWHIRWRADDGPLIVIFRTLSSLIKNKKLKKRCQSREPFSLFHHSASI